MNITGSFGGSYTVQEILQWGFVGSDNPQALDNAPFSFANGTGAAAVINEHYEKGVLTALTLAASASLTLTLSALTDELGRSVAFGHVCVFHLRVTAITAGDQLVVKTGVTHAWSDGPFDSTGTPVRSLLLLVDATGGWTVAAGSNDQVTITNTGSHPITFVIGLAGTST